jgi:hypothetical protein
MVAEWNCEGGEMEKDVWKSGKFSDRIGIWRA